MGQRRRFTPEFKRQAVLLLNAGQRPAAEIARELGVPRNRSINGSRTWPHMVGDSRGPVGKRSRRPNWRASSEN